MNGNRRNIDILQKIIMYCDQISDARERLGDSLEALGSDVPYTNTTAMCILQIGELTTHLSEDFKKAYNAVPWRAIKDMQSQEQEEALCQEEPALDSGLMMG